MYSYPSLKQRVFLCNKESTGFQNTKGPRGTYRNYTTDGLSLALKGLEEGMSYRRVSEMYNIPRATLHDHVSGKVKFGARSGPEPYLNIEEEEELASFLIHTARIGFPHTKKASFCYSGANTWCESSISKCDKWTVGAVSTTASPTYLEISRVFGAS